MAIADLEGKYQVKLNAKGYILARTSTGRVLYEKKPAPTFVSKFGSGDSSYRDSTFWQFWAQLNWRNGAKQERFDDSSKFWKSEGVDITQIERAKLSRDLVNVGVGSSGEVARASVAWRSSQSWWDNNYSYRKQLTITAPSTKGMPVNMPVVITEDTAALQTASKLRSDRNDWRVVYWNGTTWTDLTRHYVTTTHTVFSLQVAIAAAGISTDYYIYYGYSSASDNKQPTDDATWNAVYGMYGTTFDANTLGVWHFKEGTGSTVADQDASYDMTAQGSYAWSTSNMKFGSWGDFTGTNAYVNYDDSGGAFNLGSLTAEAWIRTGSTLSGQLFNRTNSSDQTQWNFQISSSKLSFFFEGSPSSMSGTGNTTLTTNTTYHVAITNDGAGTVKLYLNGVLDGTFSGYATPSMTGTVAMSIGGKHYGSHVRFDGYINHARISNVVRTSFPYAFNDAVSVAQGTEETTQPPASSFATYTGFSDGKIYSWDGIETWTEVFDCRRLSWYETGNDTDKIVGDTGGTETAQSQGFKVTAAQSVKSVQVYLKKNAGTPGDITVRIETDNAGVPSGTLAHANATTTITAFTTTSYAWKEAVFTSHFSLSAATLYHLVLKTAAAANDNNYAWASDGSSPSYTDGAMSVSTNGGSTWSAVSAADAYFRVQSRDTDIYAAKISSIGGTQKQWWGVGDIANETDGDARLYTYNGSVWALAKSFTDGTSSAVTAIEEYNSKIYIATAPQAYILSTVDGTTWVSQTQIRTPQNPGFIYAMKEYNQKLYVGGGSPEFLPNEKYNGFLYYHDGTIWQSLYPFDHTVITCMAFYDAFLFIGTYHGQVYIYDTSSLDPLINFKDDFDYRVQTRNFTFFDDKMYICLSPQTGSGDTNSALWLFERHGISAINPLDSSYSDTGFEHLLQVNNTLLVGGNAGRMYKISSNTYEASGYLQTSYFDAILPSIDKLYNELKIQHDPLPTGTSITVSYKFKEGDSWTSLGSSSTPNATEATLSFASGVYSKKISLKYTLATSDVSVTPTLRESVLKYTLMPARKWQWNLRLIIKGNTTKDKIILLDKTQDTRTAGTLRSDIESAQNSNSLITFIDVDGTSYTVLFNTLDEQSWVVNNGSTDQNENTVAVTLLEA